LLHERASLGNLTTDDQKTVDALHHFQEPLEICSVGKVAVLMGDNSSGISVPDAEVVKITPGYSRVPGSP
jgi:hypothetical protein